MPASGRRAPKEITKAGRIKGAGLLARSFLPTKPLDPCKQTAAELKTRPPGRFKAAALGRCQPRQYSTRQVGDRRPLAKRRNTQQARHEELAQVPNQRRAPAQPPLLRQRNARIGRPPVSVRGVPVCCLLEQKRSQNGMHATPSGPGFRRRPQRPSPGSKLQLQAMRT